MNTNQDSQLYNDIVNKCWEDESFKQRFLKDPAAALESDFKKFYQDKNGRKLVAIDQTDASTVFLNIPRSPVIDDIELTDDQLESVAGGYTSYWCAAAAITALGAAWGELNDSGDRWF